VIPCGALSPRCDDALSAGASGQTRRGRPAAPAARPPTCGGRRSTFRSWGHRSRNRRGRASRPCRHAPRRSGPAPKVIRCSRHQRARPAALRNRYDLQGLAERQRSSAVRRRRCAGLCERDDEARVGSHVRHWAGLREGYLRRGLAVFASRCGLRARLVGNSQPVQDVHRCRYGHRRDIGFRGRG
jgi:hypothetical protein